MKKMKVLILCGGRGIRLGNESDYIPKAMVRLGYRPILWHVMKRYSLAGYNEFILALGKKGELIRDYFTRYREYSNDIEIHLGTGGIKDLTRHQEDDWRITFVDSGEAAMTGARIARCKQYLDGGRFMVTYADCLADIDISKLITFHKKSKKIATVTGVIPPYREGELLVKDNVAIGMYNFKKAQHEDFRLFNGGYMVFEKRIFSYLDSFNECKLETEVFLKLITDRQLAVFPHHGFWRWLDTDRDFLYLNELVDKNQMYWLQE